VGETEIIVGIVTGGHFLSHFYILVFPPLFPLLRPEFSLSNTQLGVLVSVISVAMLLQVPVGELVDRIGAKYVFVTGVAVTSLGVLLAGFATSYVLLLACATLSGIGQSAYHPANYPLLETVSDADQRGRVFSIHTFGGYVGFAAAPVIVGGLGITYGWRTALLVSGAGGLLYAIFGALALPPVYRTSLENRKQHEESQEGSGLTSILQPNIVVMSLFFVVFAMAERGIQTFTSILAFDGFQLTEAVGNSALSVFFAVTALTVLIGGVCADWFDPRRVIAVSTAAAASTLFVLVYVIFPVGSTIFVILFGIAGGAFGLVFASRDRLVSMYTPIGSTGRSFGFVFTASSLGSFISPVLLGWIIDGLNALVSFALIGCFLFGSGLVVLILDSGFLSASTPRST
jgi:MFS family permease